MTVVIQPDWKITPANAFQFKATIATKLRSVASSVLGLSPDSIDVRDTIVGGSAVTTAQTGLAVQDSGAAVDMVLNTFATTDVGWETASSSVTAFTLSPMNNLAVQARCCRGKVFAFYGVWDITSIGDLVGLRFLSGSNVRAELIVQEIYETNNNQLIGGHFVDDSSGLPAAIFFGLTIQEPMTIQGIWQTSANKKTALRCLTAEKAGETVTATGIVTST